MQKRIEREYVLTAEEVRDALWRYLKEHLDQPVPSKSDELTVSWNAPGGEMFVRFRDNHVVNP